MVPVAVPIVVPVPVAFGAPFMAVRVVPGMGLIPAAVPRGIQFGPCIFSLAAMAAMLMNFVPIMLFGFFDALLAPGALVSGCSRRGCADQSST